MATRPRPITKAAFARSAGVSRAAVTKACRPGGPLADALLRGGRVDGDHRATKAYLSAHGAAPARTRKTPGQRRTSIPPPSVPPAARARVAEPHQIRELLDLTLRELTDRWGSVQGAVDWLTARQLVARIDLAEQRLRRERGSLISRAFVQTHVFATLDAYHRQLLHDGAQAIAARLNDAVRANEPLERCVEITCEIISSQLATIDRKIRGAIVASAVPSGAVPRCPPSPPSPARVPAPFPVGEVAVHLGDSVFAAAPDADRAEVEATCRQIATDAAQPFSEIVTAIVDHYRPTPAAPEEDHSHAEI